MLGQDCGLNLAAGNFATGTVGHLLHNWLNLSGRNLRMEPRSRATFHVDDSDVKIQQCSHYCILLAYYVSIVIAEYGSNLQIDYLGT